jgi:methylated-DNA-protein-cysteine methyltransferase related protein
MFVNMGLIMQASSLKEEIWQIVAAIPKGKVATYGQIARLAGFPNHSRYVGSTLKSLPKGTKLPWFRVINAKGESSFPVASEGFKRQKGYLESEGVIFKSNRLSLKSYQWRL